MTDDDKKEFAQVLRATFEMLGAQPPTPDALRMWWAKMLPYSMAQVRTALSAYLDTAKHAPKWAEVRELLPAVDGDWPSPEKAVSMMAFTEDSTSVMCQEMIAAAFAVQEQFESGDRTGARINAKRIYEDEVRRAKAEGKSPSWRCIDGQGLTYEQREHERIAAWQAAHAAGLLSESQCVTALQYIGSTATAESTVQSIASIAKDLPALEAPLSDNDGKQKLRALL